MIEVQGLRRSLLGIGMDRCFANVAPIPIAFKDVAIIYWLYLGLLLTSAPTQSQFIPLMTMCLDISTYIFLSVCLVFRLLSSLSIRYTCACFSRWYSTSSAFICSQLLLVLLAIIGIACFLTGFTKITMPIFSAFFIREHVKRIFSRTFRAKFCRWQGRTLSNIALLSLSILFCIAFFATRSTSVFAQRKGVKMFYKLYFMTLHASFIALWHIILKMLAPLCLWMGISPPQALTRLATRSQSSLSRGKILKGCREQFFALGTLLTRGIILGYNGHTAEPPILLSRLRLFAATRGQNIFTSVVYHKPAHQATPYHMRVFKDTRECECAIWDQQTKELYTMINNVKDFQAWREGAIPIGALNLAAMDVRGVAV